MESGDCSNQLLGGSVFRVLTNAAMYMRLLLPLVKTLDSRVVEALALQVLPNDYCRFNQRINSLRSIQPAVFEHTERQ